MDRLRIVSFSTGGRPIVELDLNDGVIYALVRDTFKASGPTENKIQASSSRRFGGQQQAGATHGNGTLEAEWYVQGATADASVLAAEVLLTATQNPARGRYVEWRPENATRSVYYEIRGTATYEPMYRWIEFATTKTLHMKLAWTVAPLAEGDRMDIVDDFSIDSISDYTFETGSGSIAVSGGQLVPSSTAEKRFFHTARGYKYTDAQVTMKYTTGAAATSETWLLGRRQANGDALFAKTQNGFVVVGKRVGGVDTNLASTAITALAANTPYWLRLRMEGNAITAEHFTAAPGPGATPAFSTTTTLTGGDITALGAAVSGDVGMRMVALPATDWRYDDFEVLPWTYSSRAVPARIDLGGAIPGDAPAKAAFVVDPTTAASNSAIFGMFAWAPTPGAPLGGSVPFGVIQGESGSGGGYSVTADANMLGGQGLSKAYGTGASISAANLRWTVDPGALMPDDFSQDEMDLEIWVRLLADQRMPGLSILTSLVPQGTITADGTRYTGEWGNSARPITATNNAQYMWTRLGTITVPVDRAADRQLWVLNLYLNSSGNASAALTIGVDALVLVPARARAALPTAIDPASTLGIDGNPVYPYPAFKPNDTTYFYRKRVESNLSSKLMSTLSPRYWASGSFGGSPIELPPGNVSVVMMQSDRVPDTAYVDGTQNLRSNLHVSVIPRYFLARGA